MRSKNLNSLNEPFREKLWFFEEASEMNL